MDERGGALSTLVVRDSPGNDESQELFAALASSESPALASDAGGRVVFWNVAAERLLSRSGAESLGRRCHDVLAGRDVFGNRFCQDTCAVMTMVRRGEAVRGFELLAGPSTRPDQAFHVTIVKVPGPRSEDYRLVHILDPIDGGSRLARALERLGAGAELQAADASNGAGTLATALTKREQEILRRATAGLQNKDIATDLGISLATVRNHVHRILYKLGVHSKLEAVSLAFRHGWVARTRREAPARRAD